MGNRIWFVLLPAFVLSGQPHARPPSQPPSHARNVGPVAKASDAEIQSRIQAKLANSKIAKNGFRFTTSGGVTTIEGKTGVIQHKGAATRLAKAAGARAVVNRIQISEEARNAAKQKLATSRRRAQVTRGEQRSQPR